MYLSLRTHIHLSLHPNLKDDVDLEIQILFVLIFYHKDDACSI